MATESSAAARHCPQCGARSDSSIECTACGALMEPAPEQTLFEVMGVAARFELDPDELRQRFRVLTRRVHPDRFVAGDQAQWAIAVRLSALVNRAMEVLSDPIRRADYLLSLHGGPSSAEERTVPGNLLAEVMMLREEIEEARERGDEPALEAIRQTIQPRQAANLAEISRLASALQTSDAESRRRLRQALNAAKYFENLLAEVSGDPLASGGH